MGITTHAQNFEDVILWRVLEDVEEGTYIDVGANHPVVDSVSLAFYKHGWRGIHIEPVEEFASQLREARPDEIVVQAAIGMGSQDTVISEVVGSGLSTGDAEIAKRHADAGYEVKEISVKTRSLSSIFDEIEKPDIHWLKIDVEGMEKMVLESWGDSTARPWVVLVESTLPNTQIEDYDKWENHLLERGYSFEYFDGLNRFYLHESQKDRSDKFGPGPNIFDDFSLSEISPLITPIAQYCESLSKELEETKASLQGAVDREAGILDNIQQTVDSALKRQAVEAKGAREQLKARIGDLQTVIQDLKAKEKSLNDEINNVNLEHAKISSKVQGYEDEISTLNQTVEEFGAAADDYNKQLEGLQSERDKLLGVNEHLSAELSTTKRVKEDLVNREQKYQHDIELLNTKVTEVTLRIENMKLLRERQEQKEAELLSKLEHVEKSKKAELDDIKTYVDCLEKEAQANKSDLQNYMTSLEEVNAQVNEKNERIDVLQQDLANKKHELWSSSLQVEQLHASLEAVKNSSSWRLSYPVRLFGRVARYIFRPFKSTLRSLLSFGLMVVRKLPFLKPLILVPASLFPPVKRKLIHFGQVRSTQSFQVINNSTKNNIEPDEGNSTEFEESNSPHQVASDLPNRNELKDWAVMPLDSVEFSNLAEKVRNALGEPDIVSKDKQDGENMVAPNGVTKKAAAFTSKIEDDIALLDVLVHLDTVPSSDASLEDIKRWVKSEPALRNTHFRRSNT